MSKFNYKFASIQRIKNTIEKKTQRELSQLELLLTKKKNEIIDLKNEKQKRKEEKFGRKTLKVHELKFYESVEKDYNEKIEKCIKEFEEIIKKIELKKEELIEKSKETKMFDKLEVKHKNEFQIEQNKIEQIELDDIGTKNFVRKK